MPYIGSGLSSFDSCHLLTPAADLGHSITTGRATLTATLSIATTQNDMREFIAAIERQGELATITDAHWNKEMGAVVEVLYRQKVEKSPMLVFDEIPDYPKGYRTAYGMFGSPFRLALVLGMDTTISD